MWQERVDKKIYAKMNRDKDCIIIVDFKMKFLSLLFRESMTGFFGKRGITWMGMAITRYKLKSEIDAEKALHPNSFISELKTEFIDIVSNDSKVILVLSIYLSIYLSV